MKKIFAFLILLTITLLSAMGFASCEDENGTIIIPDIPTHTHAFTDTVVNPTCAAAGYTLHQCACGEQYKDSYTDALGHDFGAWEITKEPTCTEKGTKTATCTRCDETKTADIEKTGHNYETEIIASTCTEQGYTTHTCTRCGDSYIDTYIDKLEHDYEWTTTVEPTETKDGLKTGVCKRCGDTITQSIPKSNHEHNYIITVQTPTCTEKGYALHQCACGEEYKDNYINELGHNCTESVINPTCTEQGYTVYTCKRCGESFKGDYVDTIDHIYVSNKTLPTCTTQGYTTFTCTMCGDSYKSDYTNAKGHNYKYNYEIDSTNMTAEFRCSMCRNEINQPIVIESEHPVEGYNTYKATISNGVGGIQTLLFYAHSRYSRNHIIGTYNDNVISAEAYYIEEAGPHYEYNDAFEYFFDNEVIRWNAGVPRDCEDYALACFDCISCRELVVIELSGAHNYSISYMPNCTEQGYTMYTCMDCGYSYYDYHEPTGHKYEYFYDSIDKDNLTAEFECSKCGNIITQAISIEKIYYSQNCTPDIYTCKVVFASGTSDTPTKIFDVYMYKSNHRLIDTIIDTETVYSYGEYNFKPFGNVEYICGNYASMYFECSDCHGVYAVRVYVNHSIDESTLVEHEETDAEDAWREFDCLCCGEHIVETNKGTKLS